MESSWHNNTQGVGKKNKHMISRRKKMTKYKITPNNIADVKPDTVNCMNIITEVSELLADESDYETNIKPKLQKVLDFLEEKGRHI
jgi:hypothetical protein|tara:strand:+ start:1803 stop:2060 length:258 start_codon:yes stop_codon:yes gene_type:complete